MEKIKVKKSIIEKFIEKLVEHKINEFRSEDNVPITQLATVMEPPVEQDAVNVDPKTDEQVHDFEMPIEDKEWTPGNNQELGLAMKQMSDWVPESQFKWFYPRLKRLVDKSIDRTDADRMQPRLGIIHNDE